MAGYKGHIAGGLVAGTTILAAQYFLNGSGVPDRSVLSSDWQLIMGVELVSVLFGLWPDVDTNSKAQDIFFGLAFIFDALLILNGYFTAAALLGFIAMTPILGHHRGWTHSKLTMIILPLPFIAVPYLSDEGITHTAWLLYAASVAGIFSHLLLDGLVIKQVRIKSGWRS